MSNAIKTKRLIINLPPRYLKSFCASVAFPAWSLALRPESKVMCIAGNCGLAEDQHQQSLRLMTHPCYRSLFPHLKQLTEHQQTIRLPHGGLRSAHVITPSSGITGRGADTIIIDDPIPAGYSNDLKRLQQVNLWYDQNVYQRLNDKQAGVVIVVMQRLNMEDLTGHLLKQTGWDILNLPAVAMADETFSVREGPPIYRQKGESLNPDIETVDALQEAMHRIGAKTFMAQYQQTPYPPGKGEGFHGAYNWLELVGAEMPSVGEHRMAFIHRSQECLVDEALFGMPKSLPDNDLGLRMTTADEWITLTKKIKRHVATDDKGV